MPLAHAQAKVDKRAQRSTMMMVTVWIFLACLLGCLWASTANAGLGGLGNNQAVGGVVIQPDGTVRAATPDEQREMASVYGESIDGPQGDLTEGAELRLVSLAKLQDELRAIHENNKPLTEEIGFLAGLQRIEYVIVDKDREDIILGGPAEPWKLQADGSVVGKESLGSVVRLDDLVTAFRSVEQARHDGGIRCSIEPTPEGRRRLQGFLSNVKLRPGQNPKFLEAGMRQAFGPQNIKLAGVTPDSRFARTLVAADFEMKRIAMALTPSPVAGLPSYLEMARNSRQPNSQNPRWWMACNYDPIAHDAEGKVWKISGQGVKTLTEEDIVTQDGSVRSDGSRNPIAVKWAETMTDQYDALSKEKSVFRDLRNAMDLIVVATLITQEQLDQHSNLDLSVLRGTDSQIEMGQHNLPKTLEPQCSFIHGRAGWTVTASGGVNINAFGIVDQQVENGQLETLTSNLADHSSWWWNAQ